MGAIRNHVKALRLAGLASLACVFGVAGCKKDAGDKVEDALDDAGDAIDDAADDVEDAVDDAADEIDDAVDDNRKK